MSLNLGEDVEAVWSWILQKEELASSSQPPPALAKYHNLRCHTLVFKVNSDLFYDLKTPPLINEKTIMEVLYFGSVVNPKLFFSDPDSNPTFQ